MTPKLAGALDALKQLQSAAEDTADKITKRINTESLPALKRAEAGAHKSIDGVHNVVDDIDEFVNALAGHNGGDPLDSSEPQSQTTDAAPRSSEVAQK